MILEDNEEAIHPEVPCRRCGGTGIAFEATPRVVQLLTHNSIYLTRDPVTARGHRVNPERPPRTERFVRVTPFLYEQGSTQGVTLGPLAVVIPRLESLLEVGYEIDPTSTWWTVPDRSLLCSECKGWGGVPPR